MCQAVNFYTLILRNNHPTAPMAVGNGERHPLESSMGNKGPSDKSGLSSSYNASISGYPARRPTGVDMALGLSGYAVKVIIAQLPKPRDY